MSAIEAYKKVQQAAKPDFNIMNHVAFVKRIANSLKNKIPQSIAVDDLIQVGLISLIGLHEKYNPEEGHTFENFASMRVKGSMIDLIRENTPVSKEKAALIKKANNFIDDFLIKNGYKPRESEVAEFLHVGIEKYQAALLEYESIYSVDISDMSIPDINILSPESMLDDQESKIILIEAIKLLDDREQKLISLYFLEELTQSEIAEILSLTESRVCQLLKTTLVKLRELFHSLCRKKEKVES
jgi:RNA polymerase sigma factor for flagellar operon FliA